MEQEDEARDASSQNGGGGVLSDVLNDVAHITEDALETPSDDIDELSAKREVIESSRTSQPLDAVDDPILGGAVSPPPYALVLHILALSRLAKGEHVSSNHSKVDPDLKLLIYYFPTMLHFCSSVEGRKFILSLFAVRTSLSGIFFCLAVWQVNTWQCRSISCIFPSNLAITSQMIQSLLREHEYATYLTILLSIGFSFDVCWLLLYSKGLVILKGLREG